MLVAEYLAAKLAPESQNLLVNGPDVHFEIPFVAKALGAVRARNIGVGRGYILTIFPPASTLSET